MMNQRLTNSRLLSSISLLWIFCIIIILVGCGDINTLNDPHFDAEGHATYVKKNEHKFSTESPSKVQFYVEVSGSMNGFFRSDQPTLFKTDLWKIISHYDSKADSVITLTKDGNICTPYSKCQFRSRMNFGGFQSDKSTSVPDMLKTILDSLENHPGEVAVLVSDMKYSPVGQISPKVLLKQYATDITKILNEHNKAVSLVCATSDYLLKNGKVATEKSPYYYLILGDGNRVADVRNQISRLLDSNFVDNIDAGFDFGRPDFSFGIPNKCQQINDEPSFGGFEKIDGNDTCTIRLKVLLDNYRWILADTEHFRSAFKVKVNYGSAINVGKIEIKEEKTTWQDIKRHVTAIVDLTIPELAMDMEVIEWWLELPNKDVSRMDQFLQGATKEEDVTKSYSVKDFCNGMFEINNDTLLHNYIFVTKKN